VELRVVVSVESSTLEIENVTRLKTELDIPRPDMAEVSGKF
jgi:hypothetical protein